MRRLRRGGVGRTVRQFGCHAACFLLHHRGPEIGRRRIAQGPTEEQSQDAKRNGAVGGHDVVVGCWSLSRDDDNQLLNQGQ